MKNWLGIITIILALFGTTAGALEYFAKAEDLRLVAGRLEQKIRADKLYQTMQRLHMLEDRNKSRDCATWEHEGDRAECRLLQLQIEILKDEEQ